MVHNGRSDFFRREAYHAHPRGLRAASKKVDGSGDDPQRYGFKYTSGCEKLQTTPSPVNGYNPPIAVTPEQNATKAML